MKTKKWQNIDMTELSPNKSFPKNFLKNVSVVITAENTETNLYMLGEVRRHVESKDLNSNSLIPERPFPYVTELSSSQGIGALDGH